MRSFRGGVVAALVAALGSTACATGGDVTRVMDGHVVVGRFIPPDAYSSFLQGALAEEKGQLPAALNAYSVAAAADGDDPEVWSRIGDVICKLDPNDARSDAALARARKIDSSYGPAFEAGARCEAARGHKPLALLDDQHAAAADPDAVRPQVRLGDAIPEREQAEASRDRLLALTLLHETSPAAWEALAAWAAAHRDPMLAARALGRLARISPERKHEIGSQAVLLAGDGALPAARLLAALLLDEPGDRSSGGMGPSPAAHPLIARLAVDEALIRGDVGAARRRAVVAHLGLDVVAGRAFLLGSPRLAAELALPGVLADPDAKGVRMVLAVAASRLGDEEGVARALATNGVTRGLTSPVAEVAPEAWLPFAKLVESESEGNVTRTWLAGFSRVALLSGDALTTSLAVDLAARGALAESALPVDARVELLARRSEPLPSLEPGAVDARHLLFAWSLERPLETSTLRLARRLAPASLEDPLVAVAIARLSIAEGRNMDASTLDQMLTLDPADPILAAAAFDMAKRSGDARAIGPARARLTALATTPRERAHALE